MSAIALLLIISGPALRFQFPLKSSIHGMGDCNVLFGAILLFFAVRLLAQNGQQAAETVHLSDEALRRYIARYLPVLDAEVEVLERQWLVESVIMTIGIGLLFYWLFFTNQAYQSGFSGGICLGSGLLIIFTVLRKWQYEMARHELSR